MEEDEHAQYLDDRDMGEDFGLPELRSCKPPGTCSHDVQYSKKLYDNPFDYEHVAQDNYH